jgi:uncharacterized phage infection (PIP) family protein YhgE
MGKILTLLFIFLLIVGLMASYLFLTKQITVGSEKITTGQKQIDQGEKRLVKGKAKLSRGQKQLSQTKNEYDGIKTGFYASMATLPVTGEILAVVTNKIISNKIAEGDQAVAEGEHKIKVGEQQLNAGKLELSRGIEKINLANKIRIVCAIAAGFFTFLLIVLGFCWRRALIKFLKHTDT